MEDLAIVAAYFRKIKLKKKVKHEVCCVLFPCVVES